MTDDLLKNTRIALSAIFTDMCRITKEGKDPIWVNDHYVISSYDVFKDKVLCAFPNSFTCKFGETIYQALKTK